MELRDFVVKIISETLGMPSEDVHDDNRLADIAQDSIALFELLIRFESALGRHVQYEEISHIETVGDIVAYARTLPAESLTTILGTKTPQEHAH